MTIDTFEVQKTVLNTKSNDRGVGTSDMWMYKGVWILLCMSWIIVGFLGELGDTVFRGECRSEGLFKGVLDNVRLKNYVISSQDVHSLQDCVVACMNEAHCSSYNFQVSGVPLHKCELNFKSRSTARPGSLVQEDGFQYFEAIDSLETKDLCESAGCLNGGTCKENCGTSFPRTTCECPASFTGTFCESSKTGNFLLNYNASTMNDHTSVPVTREDFKYLAVYVWVKPSSSDGVVFSYATDGNPREMALLFNETNIVLHLGGQVIIFDSSLPKYEWSHLCFILSDKTKLSFLINSLQLQNTTELPHEVTIKGTGTLVPAFDQISPGIVNISSGSHLTVTRLYVKDVSGLEEFEILRVYNEPKFAMLTSEPFRLDWKKFYHTNSKSNSNFALIAPSEEPDIGNYDLQFPTVKAFPTVKVDISHIPPMKTFVLAMWIRVDSPIKSAGIFALESESDVIVLAVIQHDGSNGYKFHVAYDDGERSFADVITDTGWFHMLWYWRSATGKLRFYKNGNQMHEITDVLNEQILPKIINGKVEIGNAFFHGDITSLNLWSFEISLNMIVTLALNPGNAAGDLFSWKSVKEAGYVVSAPSKCHNRPGQFDLIFPEADQTSTNIISMTRSYTSTFNSTTAAFWINIPSSADAFTLISYAIPSQGNEFSVHFGTTGIRIYLHGNKSFVSLVLSSLVGKWQHFVIAYSSSAGNLYVYHNGGQILKTPVSSYWITANDAVLVVGAQQSGYKQITEPRFQFVGELSQLQIYRRLFTASMIRTLANRCWNTPGNYFEWVEMRRNVKGNVKTRNPSECIKVKNGETY